jgi:hypothetical protein
MTCGGGIMDDVASRNRRKKRLVGLSYLGIVDISFVLMALKKYHNHVFFP